MPPFYHVLFILAILLTSFSVQNVQSLCLGGILCEEVKSSFPQIKEHPADGVSTRTSTGAFGSIKPVFSPFTYLHRRATPWEGMPRASAATSTAAAILASYSERLKLWKTC